MQRVTAGGEDTVAELELPLLDARFAVIFMNLSLKDVVKQGSNDVTKGRRNLGESTSKSWRNSTRKANTCQ
jgi:hypothetical protein